MKWLLAISAMIGALAFCDEPAKTATTARISSMESLDDSRILKVGDRISLRIVEDKETKYDVNVQQGGVIMCPHVGLLKAEGLTMKALAFVVKKELEKQYFEKATVIMTPEEPPGPCNLCAAGPTFTIFGMVGRQGKYELAAGDKLTLSGAIVRVGGLASPTPKEGKIVRKGADGVKAILFDVQSIATDETVKNLPIQSNDVIILFPPRADP